MGTISEPEFQEKLLKMMKACETAREEIKIWRLENEKMKSMCFKNIEEENKKKKEKAAAEIEEETEPEKERSILPKKGIEEQKEEEKRKVTTWCVENKVEEHQNSESEREERKEDEGEGSTEADQNSEKEAEEIRETEEEGTVIIEEEEGEATEKKEENEGNLMLKLLRGREEEGAEVALQGLDQFFDLMGQAQKKDVLKEKKMSSIVPINIASAIVMGQGPILERKKFGLELKILLGQRKGHLHKPKSKEQGIDRNCVLNVHTAEICLSVKNATANKELIGTTFFNGAMGSCGNFSVSSITGSICFKLWDPGGMYLILLSSSVTLRTR